ncbi:MAG: hypothetical protein ACXVW3_09515 [Nocardioidaceae bacterium]
MLTPSRTPFHRSPGRLLAVSVLALGALAGCSSPSRVDAAPPRQATSPSPSPSAAVSTPPALPSPSPTPAATSAVPSPSAASGPAALMIPGADLPGPGNGFVWADGPITDRESDDNGGGLLRCNRFTMTDIGAEGVVQRRYVPPAGSGGANPPAAAELVANFPDEQTARSAVEVLRSWHRPCDDRLSSFPRHDVGQLDTVSIPGTPGADAGWYLLKYGPLQGDPNSLWFDAEGFVRVGDRVALVTMTQAGQQYDYPAGQEPLVVALRDAAARL